MTIRRSILPIILIGISCVGGMCSKSGDDNGNGNGNGTGDTYVEPVLKPADTWAYLTSTDLVYNDNNRPTSRKWIATKVQLVNVIPHTSGDTTLAYAELHLENTDKQTRFLLDANNPGGKEVFEIALNNFSRTPGPGTYYMDIDYKQGFCWYDVYKSNGDKHDSTRHQSFTNSQLTISSMTPLVGGKAFLTSGTGSFEVIYFPTGASSSSDVHTIQLTFNNVIFQYL